MKILFIFAVHLKQKNVGFFVHIKLSEFFSENFSEILGLELLPKDYEQKKFSLFFGQTQEKNISLRK